MRDPQVPAFVEPMLLTPGTQLPSGEQWLAQLKLDGARGQMRVVRGVVELRTRHGRRCESELPEIVAAERRLPDAVLDGEVVVLNDDGAPDLAAVRSRLGASAKRASHAAVVRAHCRRSRSAITAPPPASMSLTGQAGLAAGLLLDRWWGLGVWVFAVA